MVGVATLLNWDELALGGVVDGMPGIFGDGRVSAGALVGWQPRLGSHRYQLLGEMGQERFSDVGGNLLSTPNTTDTWLGYVGARLGMSETFGSEGPFELGAWLFVRKDINDATVTNTTVTSWVATRPPPSTGWAGIRRAWRCASASRFDQKRPPPESTVEVHDEPAKS